MNRLLCTLLALVVCALAACGGPAGTDAGDVPSMNDVIVSDTVADEAPPPDTASPDTSMSDAPPPPDASPDVAGDAGFRIPDPGSRPATFDSWRAPRTSDVSSPDRAHPVGIASMAPAYIEATTGSNGNAFFVFRTGPALTTFRANIFPPLQLGMGEFIHLHDGAGGVFGPEVMPTVSTASSATWPVTPDHVYVLEIHLGRGGVLF